VANTDSLAAVGSWPNIDGKKLKILVSGLQKMNIGRSLVLTVVLLIALIYAKNQTQLLP